MLDNEPFADNFKDMSLSVEPCLITLERAQKLDLLIHLLTNLHQSIIVSGPEGIGKTTLLENFTRHKKEDWTIVSIQASSTLCFESLQVQLLQNLLQSYVEYENKGLQSIFSTLDKQNQKMVVIVDDAGRLASGLIATLTKFANKNNCLRFVFAMMQDELSINDSSEQVNDDCYFIEIPPLTEKQTAAFLNYLSSRPDAIISSEVINDRLIEKVYQKTQGIPGNIISELSNLSNGQTNGVKPGYHWVVVALIAALIAIAVVLFIVNRQSSEEKNDNHHPPPQLVQENLIEDASLSPTPLLATEETEVQSVSVIEPLDKRAAVENDWVSIKSDTKTIETAAEIKIETNSTPILQVEKEMLVQHRADIPAIEKKQGIDLKQAVILEKMNDESEKQLGVTKSINAVDKKLPSSLLGQDDSLWVLGQGKHTYTIQLMALSSRKAVNDFIDSNSGLKNEIKFLRLSKMVKGQTIDKYVLIYGSYKSFAMATKKMKSLPVEYRKSWVRKISRLQKEITTKK